MFKQYLHASLSLLTASALSWAPTLTAAETPTWWHALPSNTVGSMHTANGAEALAALTPTRLYQLIPEAAQWEQVQKMLERKSGNDVNMLEKLRELGLEWEDLPQFFAGESGMACLLTQAENPNDAPLVSVLAWMHVDNETAATYMSAFEKDMENSVAEGTKSRVDYTLAGYDIIEVTSVKKPLATLVHRHGDTVVVAFAPQASQLENLQKDMVQFITTHDTGATGDSFAHSMLTAPGLADSLATGTSLVDVYFNPQALLSLAPRDEKMGEYLTVIEGLEAMGLNTVDAVGGRIALEGDKMEFSLYASVQQPFHGLMRLLDQPTHDPVPASWVPASVSSYGQIGIDLLSIYSVSKEFAIALGGAQAESQFAGAEQAPQEYVGMSLPTLLGTFGNSISIVDYGDQVPEQMNGAGMLTKEVFTNRAAFVWDMNDVAPLKSVIEQFGPMASMFKGSVERDEGSVGVEFDFSGSMPGAAGGIYLTESQFIVAIGEGVSERILRDVTGTEAAEKSLADTDMVARAHALIPPRQAMMWQVQDNNVMMKNIFHVLHEQYDEKMEADADYGMLWAMVPTVDQIDGVFGVATGVAQNDGTGILFRSILELGLEAE